MPTAELLITAIDWICRRTRHGACSALIRIATEVRKLILHKGDVVSKPVKFVARVARRFLRTHAIAAHGVDLQRVDNSGAADERKKKRSATGSSKHLCLCQHAHRELASTARTDPRHRSRSPVHAAAYLSLAARQSIGPRLCDCNRCASSRRSPSAFCRSGGHAAAYDAESETLVEREARDGQRRADAPVKGEWTECGGRS